MKQRAKMKMTKRQFEQDIARVATAFPAHDERAAMSALVRLVARAIVEDYSSPDRHEESLATDLGGALEASAAEEGEPAAKLGMLFDICDFANLTHDEIDQLAARLHAARSLTDEPPASAAKPRRAAKRAKTKRAR